MIKNIMEQTNLKKLDLLNELIKVCSIHGIETTSIWLMNAQEIELKFWYGSFRTN